ncbi:EscD/YscD/HrpQ family type III secretion system inner membrane ring protein [Pseudomonas sp. GW456-L14]|uniref:EscD/YscD/HrpQ family type III secretion system inner membrane ring protein n=1 Tax=Pseudomonas chlororaphis TaxID=587753 RepID=A0AB34C033_9PSED|nr:MULTISPECIES: type III secretion system inner membrane ring subunit SctD [Pseudomonas]KAA5839279.1 EscD/YscD/HrpQ family type III secretion system inner membrane ring protein [Pseudomonas chlororaphis]PMY31803.1 EscD/YscD/HrpQ family type III secretion system inner membrane ring protein [Pseudomonas sp. GW456-L14]PMY48981.1 EscD/YscD/HrpQ family type III secretion system inner membrane ring protein [Pseudomonas sp. GW456-L12]
MDCTYKLKWLNGPLSGRELALPVGELRIGGSDSDIALCLEQDAQATLSIEEEAIRLACATPAWVEGQPWELEQALPLGRVIDLAGQAFVLGRSGDELSTPGVPARLTQRSPARASVWHWGALAAVCGLVLAVGLLAWQPTLRVPVLDQDEWLATQLKDPQLAGLSVQRGNQGSLVLKGLCHSSPSVAGLRAKLRARGLLVYDESVCADSLLDSVRSVLSLNGYRDVEVKSGTRLDRVVIFGNIVADTTWQRTSAQLRAIQALEGWRVVNDQALLFDDLLSRLTARQVLGGLSVRVSDKALRVSGQLDAQRMATVTEVLDAFNRDGAPRLSAVFQNIPGMASAERYLPSSIVGIGGNVDSPYVQLANGMRLQQGSVLPSGYRIYALDRLSMALLKDQELISLPLPL